MKFAYLSLFLCLFAACSTTNVLTIPANQSVEIDYNNYDLYEARIKNKSTKDVEVTVLNKTSNETIRGFGLGKLGNEKIAVEKTGKLVLTNTHDTPLRVKVGITEKEIVQNPTPSNNTYISFFLINNTAKSIPLIIPNVMNPNLSPFSKSGVDLKIGQKILFREKGKKHVLLVVGNEIAKGEKLDVGKLLKAKRKELGLAK